MFSPESLLVVLNILFLAPAAALAGAALWIAFVQISALINAQRRPRRSAR